MTKPFAPHEYQKRAIKFILENGAGALWLDCGLGKTSITLAAFKILKAQGLARRMLVLAPLRPAVSSWPNELSKWDDFSGLTAQILHGPDKSKLLDTAHDISIVNYDGLRWLFESMKTRNWWWDILVADEATRLKCTNTLRFKQLRPHVHKFKRRYELTGTPAPNGLMDLFGPALILDGGNALGRYITHYRNTYFTPTGFGGYDWKIKPGAAEQIYERLRPLTLRMRAEDYLDLPPLVENDIRVELPEKAALHYKQMEQLLITELEGGTVRAVNAATATMKVRQIANGGLYITPEKWEHLHEAKVEAVQEVVEGSAGTPALIAFEFRHDLERLQKAFPDAPYLGGGVTVSRQREVEAAWNAGALPVLLAQPQSVAHGINLQGTHATVIFHSMTWDLENYLQFVRRVWRQGQTQRVVVHHIIAARTIDEVILKAIHKKDHDQTALLSALREHLAINHTDG